MQEKGFFIQKKAAVALCIVLLMLTQQAWAGPLVSQVQPGAEVSADSRGQRVLRRIARMTPLWRIMNSKPLGAYCQNHYECATAICRDGHCSTSQCSQAEAVKY